MSLLTLLKARFAAVCAGPAAVDPTPATRHVTLDDQMKRLDSVVSSSLDRMALSSSYHLAAEDQLDAAAYALRELMRDLASVMTISPQRSGAELHQIRVYPRTKTPADVRRASVAAA